MRHQRIAAYLAVVVCFVVLTGYAFHRIDQNAAIGHRLTMEDGALALEQKQLASIVVPVKASAHNVAIWCTDINELTVALRAAKHTPRVKDRLPDKLDCAALERATTLSVRAEQKAQAKRPTK